MRRAAIAALLAPLAACAGGGSGSPSHVAPTDYKSEITTALMAALSDPTNIHDAGISDPTRSGDGPYFICVRYNPREYGQYVGRREQIAYFFDGKLNQMVEAKPEQCAKVAYKPFPELEKLCRSDSGRCN
jgi:hypothetical protein